MSPKELHDVEMKNIWEEGAPDILGHYILIRKTNKKTKKNAKFEQSRHQLQALGKIQAKSFPGAQVALSVMKMQNPTKFFFPHFKTHRAS